MKSENIMKWIFFLLSALTIIFFMCCYVIYLKSYKDPRWRIFDYNSRQATEGDIYNVAEIPVVKSVELVGERKLRFEFMRRELRHVWSTLRGNSARSSSPATIFARVSIPFRRNGILSIPCREPHM